jgi:Dolichyl-phosphate-mannose-protein mannosyltransferase
MRRKILAAVTSVWVILAVALACRVGFAWDQQRRIPHQVLRTVPFAYEPGNIAFSLVTGHGYASPFHVETGPTAWEAPVYPLLIAAFFRIFGIYSIGAFAAAAVCNIVFSSLACVPIFFAGRRMAGIGVGAGAAWLWAVFPNGVILPFEWIWDTSLSGLLGATILWATLELGMRERRARVGAWWGYGLLWGFTLMTNPSFASLLPLMLAWMAWRWRRAERTEDAEAAGGRAVRGAMWIAGPALALGIAALCCVPWTIRNYRALGTFVPLRSNLGLELWLGNNDEYRETWPGWLHPIDNTSERKLYAEMGEIAYMREKLHLAMDFILTHPAREARLFVTRAATVWVGSSTPWSQFRESKRAVVRLALVCNFVVTVGAIAGLAALFWRRNAYALVVAAFVVVFPLPYYFTRPLLRYRHPVDSAVMILTAVAIAEFVQRRHAASGGGAASATPPGVPLDRPLTGLPFWVHMRGRRAP